MHGGPPHPDPSIRSTDDDAQAPRPARKGDRDLPGDERGGDQPGNLRQRQRAHPGGIPDHSVGDSLPEDAAGAGRGDGSRRRIPGGVSPVDRMADAPRHLRRTPRGRRDRACPFPVRDGACLSAEGSAGVPLHDRRHWRHLAARRRLRRVWHEGTLGVHDPRSSGADGLPSCQPRPDLFRRRSRWRAVAGGGDRGSVPRVLGGVAGR